MEKMKLLNYKMELNEDGTYHIYYDYIDEHEKSMHIDMPRVEVDYYMEILKNTNGIAFPNIKGNIIL